MRLSKKIGDKWTSLRFFYRANGLGRTLRYGLARLGLRCYRHRAYLLEAELGSLTPPPGEAADFTVVDMTPEMIDRLPGYYDGWFHAPQARERLRRGKRLLAGFIGGRPVAFQWVDLSDVRLDYIDLKMTLPADGCYLEYFWVPRDCRGLGYGPRIVYGALNHLRENQGCRRVVTLVAHDNKPSLRALDKISLHAYLDCTCFRVLFLRVFQLKGFGGTGRRRFVRLHCQRGDFWNLFSKIGPRKCAPKKLCESLNVSL